MGRHHDLVLFAALIAIPTHAATIPAVHATALDGHTVSLPGDLHGATILILGFSHNSEANTTAWEKAILSNLTTSPAISYYELPVIADAPGFIRPMIIRSIRNKLPTELRPNFVPLTDKEAAWKQASNYDPAAPDAAYILLVDRTGTIRWQTHEACSASTFTQLSLEAKRLTADAH